MNHRFYTRPCPGPLEHSEYHLLAAESPAAVLKDDYEVRYRPQSDYTYFSCVVGFKDFGDAGSRELAFPFSPPLLPAAPYPSAVCRLLLINRARSSNISTRKDIAKQKPLFEESLPITTTTAGPW